MSFSNLYPILVHISAYSVVIPIALCLICYKHFNGVSKLMLIYLIISLLTEAVQTYLHSIQIFNSIAFDVFSLFELGLIVSMFYMYLKPQGKVKYFIITLSLLSYALFIFGLFYKSQVIFNSFYTLFLFALAMFFIFKEDNDLNIPNLLDNYFYWYNTGFLLFFGTGFFLTVFDDFIVTATNGLGVYLWTIHLFVNVIFYAAISIGIWKTRLT